MKSYLRDLLLPEGMRPSLAQPMGDIYNSDEAKARLRELVAVGTPFATCGDVVSANAVRWGFQPFLSVIDGKTLREEVYTGLYEEEARFPETRRVRNPAGSLTALLQLSVREMARAKGGLLMVDGEEDLAALSLIREMPLGSYVLYGQPGKGVVFVLVDKTTRNRMADMLGSMEVLTPRVKVGVLGGTFDRLHQGHRHLLRTALETCVDVAIGLTTDEYLRSASKKGGAVLPYGERLATLASFLNSLGSEHGTSRWRVSPLNDAYGITLDEGTEALVVSEETAASAERIQEQRLRLGRKPLKLVIATVVTDASGERLSSTRIRRGEVTQDGALFKEEAFVKGGFTASAPEPE